MTDELFFFIHIPKTAGTSFRKMLHKHFSQKTILPNDKFLHNYPESYHDYTPILASSSALKSECKLLNGHFPFRVGKEITSRKIRYMVFLRHPESRLVSFLYHKKRQYIKQQRKHMFQMANSKTINTKKTRPPSLAAFFFSDINTRNGMIRYFIHNPRKMPIQEGDFREAISNLEKCEFIGLAEEFSLSIELLNTTFSWKHSRLLTENTGKSGQFVTPALKRLIIEANYWDLKFYEYGKQLFRERAREACLI